MKKITKILMSLLLVSVLALAFAACSPKTQDGADTTAAPVETSADTADAVDEGGQNPVMNFIGRYSNGGTYFLVEADGENGAKFTVEEPMTDTEKYIYTFSGTLDTDTLRVTYSDSTKRILTLDAGGSVTEETVAYNDGAGIVIFREDGTLEWQDENEAERMLESNVFTYVTE